MNSKRNALRWLALCLSLWSISSDSARAAMDGSVVEKAKAEGEVVLYTAWGLDTVQALQAVFAKKYPFIKFDVLRTGSERLLTITIAEHKQKVFRADVFSGSHLAMINHKKLSHLQKYLSAEQRAFPKEYKDPTVIGQHFTWTHGFWLTIPVCWRGRVRRKPMRTSCSPNGRAKWGWMTPTISCTAACWR